MKEERAEKHLKISLFGAVLTLIGDLLIGAARFPDGANMIDGYFAVALALPSWRPILGGLIGFLGICLEFCGLMTIYPLIREQMPRGGRFYKLSMYVYLAAAGGAVHLPCGVFMWMYKSVAEAAGQAAGYDIALKYLLYFLLPAAIVFTVFFTGASIIQFLAFAKGRTPFPKWYCVFNLLIGKVVFNGIRRLGNTALINGIGTSNMSLSAIVMFTALLLGWGSTWTGREKPGRRRGCRFDLADAGIVVHDNLVGHRLLPWKGLAVCQPLPRGVTRCPDEREHDHLVCHDDGVGVEA